MGIFNIFKKKAETKGYLGNTGVRDKYMQALTAFVGGDNVQYPIFDNNRLWAYYASPNMGVGTIADVVDDISNTVAYLFHNVEVLTKDNKVVEDSEFLAKLHNPNDRDTLDGFISAIAANLLIMGNSYVYSTTVANRLKASLYVLPARDMLITSEKGKMIAGYEYRGKLGYIQKTKMTPKEVMFMSLKRNDTDSVYGISPLIAKATDIEILLAAKKQQYSQMVNGGVKTLVVPTEYPSGRNADAYKDVVQDSIDKGNKPALVVDAPLTTVPLGYTLGDLTVSQIIAEKEQIICNTYSYPVDLLHGNSTYANADTADRQRYKIALPYAMMIAQALTNFMALPDGQKFVVNVDNVEELKKDYSQMVDSMLRYMTIDEVREVFGYAKLTPEQISQMASTVTANGNSNNNVKE